MIGRGPGVDVELLFRLAVALAAALLHRLGSADDQLAAAHVLLVVELVDRPLGLVNRLHLDESESLRLHRVAVHHDLHVLDRSHPVEELEQIALRGVKRQVSNVETRGADLHDLGLAHSGRAVAARLPFRAAFRAALRAALGAS